MPKARISKSAVTVVAAAAAVVAMAVARGGGNKVEAIFFARLRRVSHNPG